MIRKAIIGFALFVAVMLLAAVSAGTIYAYQSYFRHLSTVDEIVSRLPPEESSPPAPVHRVIRRLAEPRIEVPVVRGLLFELHPERVRMLDWHARGFLWGVLLPHHLSAEEMLGLYLHYMSFEGGRGLSYGAEHYYGKTPGQLSEQEALELCVISVSPSRNSPTRNPERFKAAVERFRARLGAPAA